MEDVFSEYEDVSLNQDDQEGTAPQKLKQVEHEISLIEREVSRLQERKRKLSAERDGLLQRLQAEQMAPRRDWVHDKFKWDQDVQSVLHDVFKLQDFRPLQREVINATLQGRNVLCLLPSGGGKSLCYQLPALVGPGGGVTLVVSPLLSLIQDQVLGLSNLGVEAAALTSITPKEQTNSTLRDMGDQGRSGPRLVYVTPEKVVASKRLMSKLEKLNQAGLLSRIVIDEAHCASAWGNDFRPDYKKLGVLKQQFPKAADHLAPLTNGVSGLTSAQVPIIALTATATHQVCEDIQAILRIQGAEVFKTSVNRPNLFYEVMRRDSIDIPGIAHDVVSWIKRHYISGESGIVYCLTRKDCEQLSEEISKEGIRARFYHADMDPGLRESAHQSWSAGRVQVMVATIAFGMGINKPDVRFVVHASISKSIENYYQESGRAGRDGLPARCLLLYRFSDVMRQAAIVCMDPTWQSNLMGITQYAATAAGKCKRAVIQAHFAEPASECCGMCDSCASCSDIERTDITAHVTAVLRALQALPTTEKRATVIQLVDAWRSTKSPDAAAAKLARAMSKEDCEEVVAQMVLKGILQFDFGFTAYMTNTYLKASDHGLALLTGATAADAGSRTKVFIEGRIGSFEMEHGARDKIADPESSLASSIPLEGVMAKRRADLVAWRKHTAEVENVFPHSIMPNVMVDKIMSAVSSTSGNASSFQSLESMMAEVLGPLKAHRYMAQLLAVLEGGFTVESGSGRAKNVGASAEAQSQQGPRLQSFVQSAEASSVQRKTSITNIQGSGKREIIELDSSDDSDGGRSVAVARTKKLDHGKRSKTY